MIDGPDVAAAEELNSPTAAARPAWIALATKADPAKAERPLRTRTIFAQVLAGSVLVILLVAVLGTIASRRVAEREAVTDAANTADLLAQAVVQPALANGLATGNRAAVAAMDRVVRNQVLLKNGTIVRIKIWTPQGQIVYSDEPRIIGQTFPLGAAERSVLENPETRAEVSDVSASENQYEQGQGRLLEVYRPVWTPNGQPLLFETYSRYSAVTQRSSQLWRGFAGITVSSLLLLVVLLLPVLWRLLDRLKRSQAQREGLLRRAVDASAEERRRIAGTLHDGVVQELAATSFAVAGAADRAQLIGQPQLADSLRSAAGTVRASIRGLRSLLLDIYPPSLESAGLEAALTDLAGILRGRQVEVLLEVDHQAVARLGPSGERLMFRVAQECMSNAQRHASASTIRVRVQEAGAAVLLEVLDDGVGFDPVQAMANPADGHFGLRVLADVAADGGAQLDVLSAPGAGTHWRLLVPVHDDARA